jgi:hypothetical protein
MEEQNYTREDLKSLLERISSEMVEREDVYLHSMLALDRIFRLPQADELLDEELKQQARDLWTKVKSKGVNLEDPPLLFGLPKDFNKEESSKENSP